MHQVNECWRWTGQLESHGCLLEMETHLIQSPNLEIGDSKPYWGRLAEVTKLVVGRQRMAVQIS